MNLNKQNLPLLLMAAIVVITIPTTIITNTSRNSQFALQLNFIFLVACLFVGLMFCSIGSFGLVVVCSLNCSFMNDLMLLVSISNTHL